VNTIAPLARKGFPSETHVKRGDRIVGGIKSSSRNSAATIRAPADPRIGFKRCCMLSGEPLYHSTNQLNE
jgi:hypothetical protein